MNTTVIVLGVLLILVVNYMIFQDYFTGTTSLKEQTYLQNGVPDTPGSDLGSPDAKNVTYSVWAFVEDAASVSENLIFSRNKDLHVGFKDGTFIVYVGGDTTGTGGALQNGQKIDVTHNFPLQKWVHILVTTEASTNGRIVDIYLDGKMVKSVNITYDDTTSGNYKPDGTHAIKFDQFQCYISKFERIPKTFDPKTAYNKYKQGNGGSNLGNVLGNFGLKFAVTKDEIETTAFQLF